MQTLCILIVAGSAGTVLDTYDLVTDLTGSKGQIVGFNSSGKPVAQDLSAPVKSYTVTLTSDGWVYTTAGPPPVSEGDPSRTTNQQIVSVSSIVADETVQQITAMPAAASQAAYYAAGVYASGQGAGTLTFTCTTAPTEELTVYVTVMEVTAG